MKLLVVGLMCALAMCEAGLSPAVVTSVAGGIRNQRDTRPPQVLGSIIPAGRRRRATSDQEAPVLRSESVVSPDGFNYVYETGNGITAEQSGSLKKGGEGEAISVQGQYHYTAPGGEAIGLTYQADENGFQPVGDHLPVPPPTPEAILRALKYIAEHPPAVEYKKP